MFWNLKKRWIHGKLSVLLKLAPKINNNMQTKIYSTISRNSRFAFNSIFQLQNILQNGIIL